MSIAGKTIAVTGAFGFLGTAVVKALLEHGATVAAIDLAPSPRDPAALGAAHLHGGVNLVDGDSAKAAFDAIAKAHGGLHGLVNIAGGFAWEKVQGGTLDTWGSVATSALSLALAMDCDPIVVVGGDFAFTDNRPYCRGTIYDAQWQEWIDKGCSWELLMEEYFSRQPEVYREDIRGERTRTAPNLVSFRDWLVERVTSLRAITVMNASGAGILHGGAVKQASLHDALGDLPPLPAVREALRGLYAASCPPAATGDAFDARLRQIHSGRKSVPVQRWIEFTGGTVSEQEILAALPRSLR